MSHLLPIPTDVRNMPRHELEDLIVEQREALTRQGQTIAQLTSGITAVQTRCTSLLEELRGERGAGSTKLARDVRAFMRKMGQPIASVPTTTIADDLVRMRLRLVVEEFVELLGAAVDERSVQHQWLAESLLIVVEVVNEMPLRIDLPELADACGDLDYVVEGLRATFGIDGAPIANAIHESNMAKQRENLRADGKILKGPDWKAPDIEGELRKQGWGQT